MGRAEGSKEHPCLPRPLGASLDLLGHVALVGDQLARSPVSIVEPFFFSGPQYCQLFTAVGECARITHPNEENVASKNPKRPTRHYASFLVVGGTRCNNLSFPLEGISQCAPYHWDFENFTENHRVFPSHLMACKCLANKT